MKRLTIFAFVLMISAAAATGCRGPSSWSLSNWCLRNRGVECEPCAPPCATTCAPATTSAPTTSAPIYESDPMMMPGTTMDDSMVPLDSQSGQLTPGNQ